MEKHIWKVWIEESDNPDKLIDGRLILFIGSKIKCLSYYKSHGGCKSGLHLGYDL